MLIYRNHLPAKPCHLLTEKRRLAVTVMMAGDARPGWVLAATCVTGELDGNFSTMITSCCICSVNISGVCRRRYCLGTGDRWQDKRTEYQNMVEMGRRWQKQSKANKIQGKQFRLVAARRTGEGKLRKEEHKEEVYLVIFYCEKHVSRILINLCLQTFYTAIQKHFFKIFRVCRSV